ncbi:hypothetical protein PFISCL1PPCAC_27797 [Pristionchus fissidentatus]|uniref:PRKR-like endoplasmic reticulum kinase n=1 Tax=Pristionchus fissidentatus TaxID=1538716 RepID=A0AAV5WYB9_9BILA|nr:hypothetical protein PFISCL1PPCAC_27797 [Pristionchus fissidentatus]
MRLAPWLLLFSSAVLSSSESHNEIHVDGIVGEDELDYDNQYSPPFEAAATRCCTDADPTDLLVVSTMDGKVQALDVANEGRIVWQSDLDGAALLGGNLGKMEPLSAEGDRFVLVPSLDGSLYMFSMEQRVLEPIPLSTDMLLHSVRIGKEAVAGGKSISTTGVDPATGKIRYHCTSAQCEQSTDDVQPMSTLVFRRVSHSIRAVDALSGSEKWNLSVSEYDATLVRKRTTLSGSITDKKNTKFVISPPKGTITAVDSCGNTLWTTSLGVHIARSWHLEGFDLNEVSLFDSNIHSINNHRGEEKALARPESLFYLGTIENDPFILCSEKLRKEMGRLSKELEPLDQSRRVDHNSRALVKAGGETYQVAEGILDEVLGRAFKQSISRLNERRKPREIRGPEGYEEEPDQMRIALPAPDRLNTGAITSNSCEVPDDGVLMIGEDNIKNAEPHGDSRGDQGWFILRPATSSKSFGGFLAPPAQCTANFMKKSLRLENDVNPLWRLLAIFLLFVTGVIGMFKFAKLRKTWREARAVVDGVPTSPELSEDRVNPLSFSDPLTTDYSGDPAPVRLTASDDLVEAPKIINQEREVDAASRKRNMSTRSGSNLSTSENFKSIFLTDYEPVKILGRGGFGVVFEAKNKLDQCHYAVKRIAVGNSEQAMERVLRESRTMARLDHPGIIRYSYTWIEKPPEGWQKETDKEILANIRARKRGISEAAEAAAETADASVTAEPSSYSIIAPPVVDRTADEESWADDINDNIEKREENDDTGASTSSGESSSSFDEDEESEGIVSPQRNGKSESIVFACESVGGSEGAKSKASRKSEISKLDTDMALVTSIDEELLPCKNTTNIVYLYIQMQLCQDKTLYAWLLANQTIESREQGRMKNWMRQLVSAVDYIHKEGLIHRDIKPQNIFFFTADTLKIGDLGLVSKGPDDDEQNRRLKDSFKNRSSSTISLPHTDNVGTRTYMSPEQLANLPYDAKVDVFSLGLIFTELNVPFGTLMERSKVLSGLQAGVQPEHLRSRPELASFVSWLTDQSPAKRPTCEKILASEFLREK